MRQGLVMATETPVYQDLLLSVSRSIGRIRDTVIRLMTQGALQQGFVNLA